jgi:hypothetical protein
MPDIDRTGAMMVLLFIALAAIKFKSNEGRHPKIPFRVLVWANPLIEAIKSRAVHLGQLSPRS